MAMLSGWVRRSATEPTRSEDVTAWTVVLAGGEGTRLARYIRRRFGRRIPKQYCRLIGERSLLEHTLDRTTTLVPPARTLTVIGASHEALAAPQLAGRSDHVLRQPAARGTGVALYVALAMIRRWTPNAIVMVTPSDHFVWPVGPFVEQTHAATCAAAELGGLVVLGVRPADADPDMGYLLCGERTTHVPRLSRVVGFVEKPTRVLATKLCERGALWNTMIVAGSVEAFWRLGRATQPRLVAMLDALVPRIGDRHEDAMLAHIYERHAEVCLSRDMIQLAPHTLLALELVGVDWSDWGRPDRVEAVLARRAAAAAVVVGGDLSVESTGTGC
jgi:mannose-1-phosphate guanylyltransferase